MKKILKYSLLLILISQTPYSLTKLITNSEIIENGILNAYFSYTFIFKFAIITYLLWEFAKSKFNIKYLFLTSFIFMLSNYILGYINDISFYYIDYLINGEKKIDIKTEYGILDALSNFGFSKPKLNIIGYLYAKFYGVPLFLLKKLLINLELSNFLEFYLYFSDIITIYFISKFRFFESYSKKGYYSFIPIKNELTLLEITERKKTDIFMFFIPLFRQIMLYQIYDRISKENKLSKYTAVGLLLLPSYFYGYVVEKRLNSSEKIKVLKNKSKL